MDFVLEVKEVNDVPQAPAAGLENLEVDDAVDSGDASATYVVPAFTDEEDDTTSASFRYEAKLVVVQNNVESLSVLPADWIKFDDKTRTFTFTPLESRHKGVYRVRIFARDTSGVETFVEFRLTVGEFNDPPVASSLVDQTVLEDVTLTDPTHPTSIYVFPAFTDEETSPLTYSYTVARLGVDGKKTPISAPDWIGFDSVSRTFTFTPHRSWHAREVRGDGRGRGRGHWRRPGHQEERLCEVCSHGFGFQRRACCELSEPRTRFGRT